jgi:WhiB family redox-sensing transcriptional regulator
VTADAGDWRDSALCAQVDPEAWFPAKGQPNKDAKRICRSCEVRVECLEYALSQEEDEPGVWGRELLRDPSVNLSLSQLLS